MFKYDQSLIMSMVKSVHNGSSLVEWIRRYVGRMVLEVEREFK